MSQPPTIAEGGGVRPEPRRNEAGLELAHRAAALARAKKAEDLVLLDLRALGAVTDYFLLASGSSEVQVRAIAENIWETLAQEGMRPWHVEGVQNRRWVLLDYVDVVVHVFHHDTRSYYLLERLWGDAARVPLPEE
jgi:ribosome-associated protein